MRLQLSSSMCLHVCLFVCNQEMNEMLHFWKCNLFYFIDSLGLQFILGKYIYHKFVGGYSHHLFICVSSIQNLH